MKRWFLLIVMLISGNIVRAQTNDIYRVKNGSDVNKVIPFEQRYQFSKFQDGRVLFRNGKISRAPMNYSLVHGEVLFVDAKKDTLMFIDNEYINKIFVGDAIYYYTKDHGHVHAINDFDGVKLGNKQFLVRMGNEKYASYERYSSTSAISSYTSFINSNGNFQDLESNVKVVLKRRSIFFLIDQNDRVMFATRPNLLKIYSKNKRKLSEYLKDNQTSFEKEEDLKNALEFASRLE
ncbi:hypothetical protein [Dyadobacter psychrophilus]|uniref:Uncharacterized protein n=1 Tax=Dyadobacter psychrophilus TaxID=651661 RepID=A0A1T5ENB8_9BACT|nr:hypothetical protein [Dyadobacter psychrophilus]SKB85427.1 hypothetical protein SAMN05660293_02621 [Dyadobacter psychrophilus]